MNDILARIAHIIDHEAFDGEGTLGQQVARRIAPILNDVWRSVYETCHNTYVDGAPFEVAPTVDGGSSAFAQAVAARNDEERARRQRAVFEVMDLEDELEAQERRHAP